ncbi:hypothetical protein BDN70DRAFT_112864 [Pholiota conissans]|uniref:Uncharacterized protein n=1 Tax=Pholiota conissans TaxID=109636 RepID=A0A9P5Z0R2_9AGAR|nr:hypothetical protein BDN70DRAFT_112864 [Pholiota conissans]
MVTDSRSFLVLYSTPFSLSQCILFLSYVGPYRNYSAPLTLASFRLYSTDWRPFKGARMNRHFFFTPSLQCLGVRPSCDHNFDQWWGWRRGRSKGLTHLSHIPSRCVYTACTFFNYISLSYQAV